VQPHIVQVSVSSAVAAMGGIELRRVSHYRSHA
jgi:hypothetical protein